MTWPANVAGRSADQMFALWKEMKQLRITAGHTKMHFEAAQQSQIDAQVPDSWLAVVSMLAMCLALLPNLLGLFHCSLLLCRRTSLFCLIAVVVVCLFASLVLVNQ